jgi:DNA-binding response OmpR family regulator
MARILTVDDSRSVRMIVGRELQPLGHQIEEAEDGEKGLAKLSEGGFDLVILDVTMPVLDGPSMLARMREGNDRTPVLMLTSEARRSTIASLLKLGIDDYILKPFKPDELKVKVVKALKQDPAVAARAAAAAAAGSSAPAGAATPASAPAGASAAPAIADDGRAKGDILVIDDMENVQKRLRQMVPERLDVAGALTGQAALGACRDRAFRAILVDNDMPDVNGAALLRQLRTLQPKASIYALFLRTVNNVAEEARRAGFDGAITKPFDPTAIDDFLQQLFNTTELIAKEDNVLKVAAFKGKEARLDNYFGEVSALLLKVSESLAEACFAEVIVDIGLLPPMADRLARLILDARSRIAKLGLEVRVVASPEIAKLLKQYTDTANVPLYQSIDEAQKAA